MNSIPSFYDFGAIFPIKRITLRKGKVKKNPKINSGLSMRSFDSAFGLAQDDTGGYALNNPVPNRLLP